MGDMIKLKTQNWLPVMRIDFFSLIKVKFGIEWPWIVSDNDYLSRNS